MGTRDERELELEIPMDTREFAVNTQMALDEAFANRSAAVGFRRKLLEAERDVQFAKKENGLNASLNATFGLSNQGSLGPLMFTLARRTASLSSCNSPCRL
jgi:outer membrane protein